MSDSVATGGPPGDQTVHSGRKSNATTNAKSVAATTETENRAVPVWTSNKRTVQVPNRFLKALGIEMPACR